MKAARYVLAAALVLAPAVAASAHPIIAAHPQTNTVHDRSPKPHVREISAHR